MEKESCHKCGKNKVKLNLCPKHKKHMCMDCCVKHTGGIGKCDWHSACWGSFF